MRLNSVNIQNFRNYIGMHNFDLSKKVTIFYGENGFGKSSFFDAIEWCITGKISRFSNIMNDIEKAEIANHDIILGDECSVEISCDDFSIKRSFQYGPEGFSSAKVVFDENGNKLLGNDNIELMLQKYFKGDNKFKKGEYIDLLKRTYILSQEQVTDFVSSDRPIDRYKALADIMGYRDIINYTNNLKKVISGLEKKKENINAQVNSINESISNISNIKEYIDEKKYIELLNKLSLDRGNLSIEDLDFQVKKIIESLENNSRAIKIYNELPYKDYKDLESMINQLNEYKKLEETCIIEIQELSKKRNDMLERMKKVDNDKRIREQSSKMQLEVQQTINFFKESNIDNYEAKSILDQLSKFNNEKQLIKYALNYRPTYNKYRNEISIIPSKIVELSGELINKREYVSQINDRRKHIESRLELVDNEKLIAKLIESLNGILSYVENINDGVTVCPVCSSKVGGKLHENLMLNIKNISAESYENKSIVEKLIGEKKTLDGNLSIIEREIKGILNNINGLNNRFKELPDLIREIEKNEYFKQEYFDVDVDSLTSKDKDNESFIQLYKSALDKSNRLTKLIDDNNILIQVINNDDYKIIDKDSMLSEEIESTVNLINSRNVELKGLRIKIDDIKKKVVLIKEIIPKDSSESNFSEIMQNIISHNDKYNLKISMINDLKKITASIDNNNKLDAQMLILDNKKGKLESVITELGLVVRNLNDFLSNTCGNFANDLQSYLNNNNSAIQKYYKYLNPLPSNKKIMFEGKEEELNIKVLYEDDKSNSNAWKVLSSGQLNVLAIAIFLAMNEAQKIHSLDFIGIDDPIQNMDSVNQFSICDVLGMIKKQIIFSTHDINFIKLFVKKNEDIKDDIQVYHFESPYLTTKKVNKILF